MTILVRPSLEDRFHHILMQSRPGDCIPWAGAKSKKGYGVLRVNGKPQYAHRVSWTIFRGPIPNEMHVLHHCDNPPCIRPSHLFLGDDLANQRDSIAKGRHTAPPLVRGADHKLAKLTNDHVREIRALHQAGTSQTDLARKFEVSLSSVHRIVHNQSWRHVDAHSGS